MLFNFKKMKKKYPEQKQLLKIHKIKHQIMNIKLENSQCLKTLLSKVRNKIVKPPDLLTETLSILSEEENDYCCELFRNPQFLKETVLHLNDPDYHNDKGTTFIDQKKYMMALNSFTEAIILNKTEPIYWYNRGTVYEKQHEFGEAHSDYAKALSLDSQSDVIKNAFERLHKLRHPNYKQDSNNHNDKGMTFLNQQKYTLALTSFNDAINLNKTKAIYWYNRGTVYERQYMFDKAHSDYAKALSLDSQSDVIKNAIEHLCNTRQADYHNDAGITFINQQNYKMALTSFNKAIAIDETKAIYWYNRGTVYEKLEMVEKAHSDYATACTRDDRTTVMKKARNDAKKAHNRSLTHKKRFSLEDESSTRGNACMRIGHYKPAIVHYTRALEISYKSIQYYRKHNPDSDELSDKQMYTLSSMYSRSIQYCLKRAETHEKSCNYSDAISDFHKANELSQYVTNNHSFQLSDKNKSKYNLEEIPTHIQRVTRLHVAQKHAIDTNNCVVDTIQQKDKINEEQESSSAVEKIPTSYFQAIDFGGPFGQGLWFHDDSPDGKYPELSFQSIDCWVSTPMNDGDFSSQVNHSPEIAGTHVRSVVMVDEQGKLSIRNTNYKTVLDMINNKLDVIKQRTMKPLNAIIKNQQNMPILVPIDYRNMMTCIDDSANTAYVSFQPKKFKQSLRKYMTHLNSPAHKWKIEGETTHGSILNENCIFVACLFQRDIDQSQSNNVITLFEKLLNMDNSLLARQLVVIIIDDNGTSGLESTMSNSYNTDLDDFYAIISIPYYARTYLKVPVVANIAGAQNDTNTFDRYRDWFQRGGQHRKGKFMYYKPKAQQTFDQEHPHDIWPFENTDTKFIEQVSMLSKPTNMCHTVMGDLVPVIDKMSSDVFDNKLSSHKKNVITKAMNEYNINLQALLDSARTLLQECESPLPL